MRFTDILSKILMILISILLVVFALSIIYPLIWMLVSGFKTNKEIFTSTWALPEEFSWENYQAAWEYGIANYMLNSIIVTIFSVILTVFVAALGAYVLSRFDFRFKNTIFIFILGGMMVAPEVTLISLFKMLQAFQLYDTYWALIITYTAFHLSFTIFLMRSYILSIPKEIEESAVIDGCGTFRIFLFIILPLSRPIIATSALLSAMWAWNEFMFAMVFTKSKDVQTLPVGLVNLQGAFSINWPMLLASLTIASSVMILVFMIFQKQMVRGLTQGGIKG